MGTAGPLALARETLDDGKGTPFFVLNRLVNQIMIGEPSGESSNASYFVKCDILHKFVFLCLSDVICDYPLKDMLDFHKARGAEATILVTKVCTTLRLALIVKHLQRAFKAPCGLRWLGG